MFSSKFVVTSIIATMSDVIVTDANADEHAQEAINGTQSQVIESTI